MAKKVNANISMKESELRQVLERNVTTAYSIALICMLQAAHDQFGFGERRLYRLLDHANKLSNELNDGDISIEDLINCMKDEDILVGVEHIEKVKGWKHPLRRRK